MAKFFILPLLVNAVLMVESYSLVPYPSAVGGPAYGYAYNTGPVMTPEYRSGLGPFFGYFPDMFPKPCPPFPPAPNPTDALTACTNKDAVSDMSSSSSGTINPTSIASAGACNYAIMVNKPATKIVVNCSKARSLKLKPQPLGVLTDATLVENTDYTIDGTKVYVTLENPDTFANTYTSCTWKAA